MGVGVCDGNSVGVGMEASVGERMITLIAYNLFISHQNPKMQDKYEIVNSSSINRTKLPIFLRCDCMRPWC